MEPGTIRRIIASLLAFEVLLLLFLVAQDPYPYWVSTATLASTLPALVRTTLAASPGRLADALRDAKEGLERGMRGCRRTFVEWTDAVRAYGLGNAWRFETLRRLTKAKQDCDTIAQAAQKYNSLEGTACVALMDLKGKYLTGIDSPRDPWRTPYKIDLPGGYVYSCGPDRVDDTMNRPFGAGGDDIRVPYIGALCLVAAKVEENPLRDADPARAFDALHLRFNRPVRVPAFATLDLLGASTDRPVAPAVAAGRIADPARPAFAFRWYEGTKSRPARASDIFRATARPGTGEAPPAVVCRYGDPADPGSAYDGTPAPGRIYHTAGSREIILALPAGTSGALMARKRYLNLTGNRMNPAGSGLFAELHRHAGAEMSGTPVALERRESP